MLKIGENHRVFIKSEETLATVKCKSNKSFVVFKAYSPVFK